MVLLKTKEVVAGMTGLSDEKISEINLPKKMKKEMRILVVAHFETMCKICRNMIGQFGFKNIVLVQSEENAIAMLKNKIFDFIISDWEKKIGRGINFLKIIRKNKKLKSIPVLLLSSGDRKMGKARLKKVRAQGCVLKPFCADNLKEEIENIFKK